jgi:internalin A
LDGLTIARERIAQEAVAKTGFLDLGRLGLTELPDELFQLKHLRKLNLGFGYFDENRCWEESPSARNRVNNGLPKLFRTSFRSMKLTVNQG